MSNRTYYYLIFSFIISNGKAIGNTNSAALHVPAASKKKYVKTEFLYFVWRDKEKYKFISICTFTRSSCVCLISTSMQAAQYMIQRKEKTKRNHWRSDDQMQSARNGWIHSKCQRWYKNCRPHPFMHFMSFVCVAQKVQVFGQKYKFLVWSLTCTRTHSIFGFPRVFDSFNWLAKNRSQNSFVLFMRKK